MAALADMSYRFILKVSDEPVNKLFSYDGRRFHETPLDMAELAR